MPDPAEVRSLFARIAGRYDLLNRTLSFGVDQRWRRALLARAGDVRGKLVVDACSGTGDVALAFARRGARVVGVDFTREMLVRATAKARGDGRSASRALFVHGDALALPVEDGAADVAAVAFGIRNVADRALALREMARVLRPGGLLLVLEFSLPEGAVFGGLYRTYFTRILPGVGALVSRDRDAYAYLPRTVLAWPGPDALEREVAAAGLVDCGYARLSRGIACLHWGRRPARDRAEPPR